MLRLAQTALATALVGALARAADVTLDWSVGWVDDVNPDGLFVRRAIGVNGQFPPPIIVSSAREGRLDMDCSPSLFPSQSQNVNQDDVLKINYRNAFGDGRATSLHSHGMFFNQTAYYGACSCTLGLLLAMLTRVCARRWSSGHHAVPHPRRPEHQL